MGIFDNSKILFPVVDAPQKIFVRCLLGQRFCNSLSKCVVILAKCVVILSKCVVILS